MFDKLKKIKFEYLIVGALIIAVVIVAAMTFSGKGEENASGGSSTDYISGLEIKLSETLSKIEGAGQVSVVITAKTGVTTEIAEDKKTVSDGEKVTSTSTPVLVGGKPIILREIYPEIIGVVIVAKGAGNITVKMSLLDAATTALGISADKIQILNQ
ncbi:MAG: hypothetical protein IJ800_03770 [Clostridia bacterium]|nr:hypothetical protein [Clostridia bacterium]